MTLYCYVKGLLCYSVKEGTMDSFNQGTYLLLRCAQSVGICKWQCWRDWKGMIPSMPFLLRKYFLQKMKCWERESERESCVCACVCLQRRPLQTILAVSCSWPRKALVTKKSQIIFFFSIPSKPLTNTISPLGDVPCPFYCVYKVDEVMGVCACEGILKSLLLNRPPK